MAKDVKLNLDPDSGKATAIPRDTLATTGGLIAPKGKYRLVVTDSFDWSDYAIDFDDREDAIRVAKTKAGVMKPCYVYDSDGTLLFRAGRP